MSESSASALSDNALVVLARCGDEVAMAELISRITPLMMSRALHFSSSDQDLQDLFQEGMLGFLSAVHSFREDGGAAFKSFAVTCASNRMKNSLSKRSSLQSLETVPLDDTPDIEDLSAGPEEQMLFSEESARVAGIIASRLSPFEKKVIRLYIGGSSYEEIAGFLDTTVKSVDNALQRIRKKIK